MKNILLKLKFIPAKMSVLVLRYGLPVIAVAAMYNLLCLTLTPPDALIYIMRQCREIVEYLLMSLVIVAAGAAVFEYSENKKRQ